MSDFNPRRWVNIRVSPWRSGQLGVAWLDNFNCKKHKVMLMCPNKRLFLGGGSFFSLKKTCSHVHAGTAPVGWKARYSKRDFSCWTGWCKFPRFVPNLNPSAQSFQQLHDQPSRWLALVCRSHRLQVSIFTLGISTGPFTDAFFSQHMT